MNLFDPGPIVWLQGLFGPAPADLFRAVSVLGSTWGIILASGLAFWLWGRHALYGVLLLAAVEAVVKAVLAGSLALPRPEAAEVIKYERVVGTSSFPSGHVSTATALWSYLGFRDHLPLAAGIGVGVLVGLTRLYLGVHWVSDVVAALVVGVALAWAAARFGAPVVRAVDGWPAFAWAVGGVVVFAATVAASLLWLGGSSLDWRAAGFVAGVGVALPLERAEVGYVPAEGPATRSLIRVVIGVAGLIPFFAVARFGGEEALDLQALTTFGATVWTLLVAPALFARFGRKPD